MKTIIIVILANLFFTGPTAENMILSVPARQNDIFIETQTDNFSQHILKFKKSINIRIQCTDTPDLGKDYEISPNTEYIKTLPIESQRVMRNLIKSCKTLRIYLRMISLYLKNNIVYSEEASPQDAASVINLHKANCVGFSNVTKFFLDAAGVENSPVKGFYLKNETNEKTLVPIPHRWIEIRLTNGKRFFYDPQFQRFSADYIATANDIDFKQIKKFTVNVIHKSKNNTNE